MATTIKLKNGSGAPTAGDLVQGEPALDLTNKRLYTEDAGGNVIEVGTSPSTIDINAGTIDGVTLGTNSAVTEIQVDNINIDGNTISSTDTDGNIALTPDGTGEVDISKVDIDSGTIDDTTIGGSTPAAGSFTTITGSGDMAIDTDTLFVNVSENRVGIGTDSPAAKMHSVTTGNVPSFLAEGGLLDFAAPDNENVQIGHYNSGTNTATERMRFASDGDISFRDTSDNEAFYWDATNARLGIGTTVPSTKLHSVIDTATEWTGAATLTNTTNIPVVSAQLTNNDTSITGSEVNLLFTAGGSGSGQHSIGVKRTGANTGDLIFRRRSGSATSAESMRLDSSGNLLVGTTNSAPVTSGNVNGISLQTTGGNFQVNRDSAIAAYFGRKTNDGDIVQFRKDGAPVGTIGVDGGHVTIGNADASDGGAGVRFVKSAGNDRIEPWDVHSNTARDGQIDLGNSDPNRFRDLYLSGGVYLGGTTSANFLDDYEEGSFTVSLTPTTSGSMTMDSGRDTLQYIKIGNMVHIMGYIRASSVSSPVGFIEFTVPFTASNLPEYQGYYAGVAQPENLASGNSNEFGLTLSESSTTVVIGRQGAGGTAASWGVSAQTFQNNTNVRIALTYRTA